jgi:hypothetical protein
MHQWMSQSQDSQHLAETSTLENGVILANSNNLTVMNCAFEPCDEKYTQEGEFSNTPLTLTRVNNAQIVQNDFKLDADTVTYAMWVTWCQDLVVERNKFLVEYPTPSTTTVASTSRTRKQMKGLYLFGTTGKTRVVHNCFLGRAHHRRQEKIIAITMAPNLPPLCYMVTMAEPFSRNLFDNVANGLYYFSGSANNVVNKNCFQENQVAIQVDDYGLSNGTISDNAFVDSIVGDYVQSTYDRQIKGYSQNVQRFGPSQAIGQGGLGTCGLCPSVAKNGWGTAVHLQHKSTGTKVTAL